MSSHHFSARKLSSRDETRMEKNEDIHPTSHKSDGFIDKTDRVSSKVRFVDGLWCHSSVVVSMSQVFITQAAIICYSRLKLLKDRGVISITCH